MNRLYLAIAMVPFFSACYDAPELSLVPYIELRGIQLIDTANSPLDQISFQLYVEDGDGNLGLDTDQTDYPFHLFDSLPTPQNWLTYSRAGRQPEFEGPGDTGDPNWRIIRNAEDNVIDTFRVRENIFQNNIYVIPYLKEGDRYVPVVNRNADNAIVEFPGRFPDLNIDDGNARPITGTLNFTFGTILESFFGNPSSSLYLGDTFRFEIFVFDRALNRSNIIITQDYTFQSLRNSSAGTF